ncbi:flagellar protein FliS [Neobacillus bataviensis LMG 21833]|uniref:Flagellar protein FliS n=1 Tax=Neobacillus bataviensis LMG 21833 TaxID=1117379 RepID=K6D5W6_9BACI|nr:flagellar export chaperone FliS [Neobacillus bataviensis]EKN63689.1 flagellar protein FliS [Neobacillus bataviensis LMG 21833]
MSLNNPYQAYENNQVLFAKGEELTLLLYKGAIKFIEQAKLAMAKDDWTRTNNRIIRAQNIISELMVTLNMDFEISQSLVLLYDYMKQRLIEANIKKEAELLTEVQGMLAELLGTWTEAMNAARPT